MRAYHALAIGLTLAASLAACRDDGRQSGPTEPTGTGGPSGPAEPAEPGKFPYGTLAFVSERDGTPEIYVIDPAGERRVTNNAMRENYIAWSPNGSRIVFLDESDGGIWVMNAGGSGLTRVANGSFPRWSPDGGRILYARGASFSESAIHVVNADGSGDVRVIGGGGASSPSWAADGTRIAFSANFAGRTDTYVINVDGSGLTNITNTPDEAEDRPEWSPDGRKIAFIASPPGTGRQIYTVNPDGSGRARLTNTDFYEDVQVWSPDSRRIAFRSNRDRPNSDFNEVYVMNADGSAQRRLTTMSWFVGGISWSGDGTRIAFAAELSSGQTWGAANIYAVNADGSGLIRVAGPVVRYTSPAWKP